MCQISNQYEKRTVHLLRQSVSISGYVSQLIDSGKSLNGDMHCDKIKILGTHIYADPFISHYYHGIQHN